MITKALGFPVLYVADGLPFSNSRGGNGGARPNLRHSVYP